MKIDSGLTDFNDQPIFIDPKTIELANGLANPGTRWISGADQGILLV